MLNNQIFFLPFAGGSRYSYNFLVPFLKSYEITPLELPGRGKRLSEELILDFDLAASDLFDQLKSKLVSDRYIIYGHSLGSFLALKLCSMLEHISIPPIGIVVSGNPGPGITKSRNRYLMPSEEFLREIEKLGGLSEEILRNDELLNFYIPILRADFELAEKNEMNSIIPVSCPIFAIMGDEEENVEKILNWSNYTTGSFSCEVLTGGHFFIKRHSLKIGKILARMLDSKV